MSVLLVAGLAAWAATLSPAASHAPGDSAADAGEDSRAHLGAVVGRVRDGDGNGIKDLLVRISSHGLETRTGVDGDYHFYSVPTGPVVVTVEVEGNTVGQRMVQVREGVVHQINMRIGRSGAAPHAQALVLEFEGRVNCTAVAAGVPVACADGADRHVNVTGPWTHAVVELAWGNGSTPLNLTAGFAPDQDPVTRRPVAPHGTEGAGPLRLVVPLDADVTELVARVRPASDATAPGVHEPFLLVVSLFPGEPPADYAAAPQGA